MFTQTAVFSTLALFASVSHAIPSTYTSLHSRAVNKRVTKEDVFWLKESETAGPIFDEDSEYEGPLGLSIAGNPTMRVIFQDAWEDSFPTPTTAQEAGGWVFADRTNPARIAVCRAAHGRSIPLNQDSVQGERAAPAIDLNTPACNPSEIPEGFVVVANFHTHPMPWDNSNCPSGADNANAWERGVPGIIIHQRGICLYGPAARDSMKSGDPASYPKQGQQFSGQKAAGRQIDQWVPDKATNQST